MSSSSRNDSTASTASDMNPYTSLGKAEAEMTPEQAFKAEH